MAGTPNGRNNGSKGTDLHTIGMDQKDGMMVSSQLKPLVDEKSGYIVLGRSHSAHRKWRRKGLLQIGAVGEFQETGQNLFGREVFLDAAFPHIVFICGKRGSGKSYTLGIFAEELIRSAIGVGVILVDPIGIFWSLKMENTSRSEKRSLEKWGLSPTSFPEVKVLAPGTDASMIPTNCDGPFTIGISEMTAEDWCQVFDMDRFKTQGLLIGTALDQVRYGYRAIIDDVVVDIPGRPDIFSIGDIVQCIETSSTITSKTGGYNPQTRRSIVARFNAAAGWGIFSIEGTPLRELTSPNRVTVLDISDTNLGDSKRSLITGIVARKVLEGRIQTARIEEHHGFDESDPNMIPLTWLLIDEAHTILPHSRQTPASEALIEYAKQGRKPGCAMILATQRPASTSDEILSQVDILVGHNLALEDDMTAMRRRVPAKLPQEFAVSDFIRGIPVGTAIVADQKTQQRSFLIKLRPRMSHHAGSSAMPKAFQEKKRKKRTLPLTGAYIPRDMPSVLEPTPLPRVLDEIEEIEEEVHEPSAPQAPPDIGENVIENIPEDPLPDIPWGTTILLKDRSREDLEIFLGNVEGARHFILFSPSDPSSFNIPKGPQRTDRWLGQRQDGDAIPINDPEMIAVEIEGSCGPRGARVIVIDELEALLEKNPPEKVRGTLKTLREKVYKGKDLLLVRAGAAIDDSILEGIFSEMVVADMTEEEAPVDIGEERQMGTKPLPGGSLSLEELKWMCSVMGLPTSGSESDLLNNLLKSEPELMGSGVDEGSRMDIIRQVIEESARARVENERLRSKIDDLESAAGVEVAEKPKKRLPGSTRAPRADKRLVLVWEDEEEQKETVEDLILEVEDLREEMDSGSLEVPSDSFEETVFSKLMMKLDEERLENRDRLNRLEDILQSEMDSLKDEIGEQRKQLEASRKMMKLRVIKQQPPAPDVIQKKEQRPLKKKRVLKRGEEVAAIQPKLGSQAVLEIAKRNLKRSLLRGPRESIDEIVPCYIQLYRFLVNYKGGLMKAVREADLFVDSITGEFVEQGRSGLRRSEGLMNLMKTTDLEMEVVNVLGRSPREPAWISKATRVDLARVKRSLSSLEKKGLVKRSRREANLDQYSITDDLNIPSRPWTRDHGFQVEFVTGIGERTIPVKFEVKDAGTIIRKLSPDVNIIDQDTIRYPIFLVKIRGEGRTRYLAIDGVGGRVDRRLSNILRGIVGTWD
ncbi:MAG: helicase HerA domain-containing protein [Thermoplasmatota archaeon]